MCVREWGEMVGSHLTLAFHSLKKVYRKRKKKANPAFHDFVSSRLLVRFLRLPFDFVTWIGWEVFWRWNRQFYLFRDTEQTRAITATKQLECRVSVRAKKWITVSHLATLSSRKKQKKKGIADWKPGTRHHQHGDIFPYWGNQRLPVILIVRYAM